MMAFLHTFPPTLALRLGPLDFSDPTWLFALFVLVPIIYLWRTSRVPGSPLRRWVSLLLRSALVLALVFSLAGTRVIWFNKGICVVFVLDQSQSVPGSAREAAKETLDSVHTLLLQYMRALLFLCCATFISLSIVLSALNVPYAMLLAAIAFPLEFIPLVGPLTAAAIIIVVSVVTGYAHVWWVIAYLAIYRMFQDYVLSPHLMSQGVELHPLLIIFGVFAGGEIGGAAGIFLSVPALALIRLLYHHRFRRRNSHGAVALNI